jgi:hypothetical protein
LKITNDKPSLVERLFISSVEMFFSAFVIWIGWNGSFPKMFTHIQEIDVNQALALSALFFGIRIALGNKSENVKLSVGIVDGTVKKSTNEEKNE